MRVVSRRCDIRLIACRVCVPCAEEVLAPGYELAQADEFKYVDPVDHSVSDKQGVRFIMADGSRVIIRLSGTGSVGATIRVYLEKYEDKDLDQATGSALAQLVAIALDMCQISRFTGRDAPTVIT
ncbi:hypothetical protein EON67_00980 [archaeon]|nr:MAG: hypothetical protein EON67_00980 [archaeon]